jgi:putative transcriptional regulator
LTLLSPHDTIVLSKDKEVSMIRWRLRIVMADRNISAQDLAKAIGLSRVSVSRLRNTANDSFPRVTGEVLDKLCKNLKCQPGDLIEYIPDEDKTEQDPNLTPPQV